AEEAAAGVCLVLGLGLLGGAATGGWLLADSAERTAAADTFEAARDLWHTLPVDTIFPRTLSGEGAGPGGADREWTRIAVAPDGDCADAFDPALATALAPVGCERLLRATYVDVTSSNVTTVGLLVTRADTAGMRALAGRFETEGLAARGDMMPRTHPAPGTAAARFAAEQRASWSITVLTDVPAVVYAVSGFADGRAITDPRPAAEATAAGATSVPAQAGLGHDARGIAERVARGFRVAAADGSAEAAR
ncbi:hypothetical protein, partial [Streptomyces sp. URMC 123]|uniref:hypothetical protein n=1 Tax=Streptomyces sp. URMC 123 TaxID=3423403 RepID=UPI003F1B9A02